MHFPRDLFLVIFSDCLIAEISNTKLKGNPSSCFGLFLSYHLLFTIHHEGILSALRYLSVGKWWKDLAFIQYLSEIGLGYTVIIKNVFCISISLETHYSFL